MKKKKKKKTNSFLDKTTTECSTIPLGVPRKISKRR
jgi:hypothetical protein